MSKNVPDIRFCGFEEEWTSSVAGNIFKPYYDKNHPELPVLSASQEYGMVVREDIGFSVQHDKANESTYKRVLPGQFVIHLRSFQGGFAHADTEGITSPAYTILAFKGEKQNDIYWKYVLTSKRFIKSLETVTYGIRDGRSISYEDFSELKFAYPQVPDEQEKIGKLFSTIDKLIRQLEAKLEKLRRIKQSLLQQMFINVNRGGTQ